VEKLEKRFRKLNELAERLNIFLIMGVLLNQFCWSKLFFSGGFGKNPI